MPFWRLPGGVTRGGDGVPLCRDRPWTRIDRARQALLFGVVFIVAGALMLLWESFAVQPEEWFFARFFLILGVFDLVIGGFVCWRTVAGASWTRCLERPEQRSEESRSWVKRLLCAPGISAQYWWPANFIWGGASFVAMGAVVSIGMLWDAPLAEAMAPEAIVSGLGLLVIGGVWLLVVSLRR